MTTLSQVLTLPFGSKKKKTLTANYKTQQSQRTNQMMTDNSLFVSLAQRNFVFTECERKKNSCIITANEQFIFCIDLSTKNYDFSPISEYNIAE